MRLFSNRAAVVVVAVMVAASALSGARAAAAADDFSAIMRLTQQEALIGLPATSEEGRPKLDFHARTEMAASWYDKISISNR